MKRLTILLFSALFTTLLVAAQIQEPRYLDDEEVTRLNTELVAQAPTNLDAKIGADGTGTGYRIYVYCNDRIYTSGCGNGNVYWFDLKNERGLGFGARQWAYQVGASDSYNQKLDVRDNWGRGFTSTGKYLIQYRIREKWDATSTRQDLYPITEFLVAEPGTNPNHVIGKDGTFRKRIILTKEQYDNLATTVGSPADISSWGDIMGPSGGYLAFVGVKTNPYVVVQKIAKINIANGNITGIQYYDVPEISTSIRQIFLKGLDKDRVLVNIRSSKVGIYDFSANNGAGGWAPEFEIATGYAGTTDVAEGRGFNLGTTGFCAFQMKGPKAHEPRNIFLFPTGAPNYTEKFTGYDIENYRWMEGVNSEGQAYAYPDYTDCYYYSPGIAPSGDQVCCTKVFNNFLYFRQDPNNQSLGYVYQVRPSTNNVGNILRCYKIEILPREDVFKAPAAGMTPQSIVLKSADGKHVTGLDGKAIFNNATIPTTHPNLNQQLTIIDYWASLYEHNGTGYDTAPIQTLVNTANNFTFTGLKQPMPAADAGYVVDESQAAKGKYKVRGHVHYKWYGQVSFKSPNFEGEIQPTYESSSAVPGAFKNVWVKTRTYPGGVIPSSLYVPIDFDKAQTTTPVSVYRVWAVKGSERIKVADVPGDFDFNNKKNVTDFQHSGENMPPYEGGENINFPFICYFNIPNVTEAQRSAVSEQYTYEIETVFGENRPKVQRTYTVNPRDLHEGVITGVEEINDDSRFNITPTLVDNVINVTCDENIRSIEIYSLSGTLVKHFEGCGNVFESLIVDDLARGTYLVKVNNYKIVKILKK